MKYNVVVHKIETQTFEVEAKTFDEAVKMSERKYANGEFRLDNAEDSTEVIVQNEKGEDTLSIVY